MSSQANERKGEVSVGALRWVVLGTASAVPQDGMPNTHFAFEDGDRLVLVDAPEGVSVLLQRAGFSLQALTDVVLTHFHPDHVSGLVPLLMGLWLQGRRTPLHLYGLEYTLSRVEVLLDLFAWKNWPDFYPLRLHPIPEKEYAPVLETPRSRWVASPGQHVIPVIGLRVEMPSVGQTLVYSADTEPCATMERLAQNATLLFHEATGDYVGHTSPAQAAALAARAGVERLYLVHLRPAAVQQALAEARKAFPGAVEVPRPFQEFRFA